MSGILATFSCAVMMRFFADRNMREGSRLGTRSLLKTVSTIAETLIFL